jgi:hypothetical protein
MHYDQVDRGHDHLGMSAELTNVPASPPAGRKTELLRWLSEEGRFAPDIGRLLERASRCVRLVPRGSSPAAQTALLARVMQH